MNAEIKVLLVLGIIIALMALFSLPPETFNKARQEEGVRAPEIAAGKWINSEPLTLEQLRGKVVLVDFWTYSCINCIRTLPYLESWHEKYFDKGLVIIGVHTPEFEFEKDYTNVKAAVERYGIKYAVVQDNDYATWNAYGNKYWPRKYLIDKSGAIRYDHIGEGGYDETERKIAELLSEKINTSANPSLNASSFEIGTPELYLGYKFAREPLGNEEGFSPESVMYYNRTAITKANAVYLSGKWLNKDDRIISVENSSLFLVYKAKDVNVVAGGDASVEILLDNKPLPQSALGKDANIENGKSLARINGERLYNIASTTGYSLRLLEIRAEPGFELYTFTFG